MKGGAVATSTAGEGKLAANTSISRHTKDVTPASRFAIGRVTTDVGYASAARTLWFFKRSTV